MSRTTEKTGGRRSRPKPNGAPPKIAEPEAAFIEALVKKGGITFGPTKPLSRIPPARLKPGKSIAEMVAEDRR